MGWSESIECGVSSIGGVMALGRAEHPCSAAAGQGWPALPVAMGRDVIAITSVGGRRLERRAGCPVIRACGL